MNNKNNTLILQIVVCLVLISVVVLGGIGVYSYVNKNHNEEKARIEAKAQKELEDAQAKSEKELQDAKEKADKELAETKEKAEKDLQDAKDSAQKDLEVVVVNQAPQVVYVNNTVYVADVYDYLSLRSAGSTSASVIAKLPPNTEMVVLSEATNPMVYVSVKSGIYSGYTGYVNREFITAKGSSLSRSNVTTYTVYGTTNYLPIRSRAIFDDSYNIDRLYNGNIVIVLEKTNSEFWKVQNARNGVTGYVACKYLR